MSDPKRVKLYSSDPIGSEEEEVVNHPIRPRAPVEASIIEDSDDDDDWENDFDSEFDNYGVARRLCKIMLSGVTDGDYLGGNIAYSKCYTGAPNPGLAVVPYEILRLPLSRRDVEAAIKTANLSLPVDGVLEVLPDLIEIRNPHWIKWVEKELLPEVVKSLGLEGKSNIIPVFQEVRVYSGGATAGQMQSSEGGHDNIGTLEVMLPSEFLGGEVVMSSLHGTEKVESGERSEFDTVAAAWYSDVTCHSAPVSDGYKVTMVYKLSTRISPKPLASRLCPSGGIITAVQDIATADEPVAYALGHQEYSPTDLEEKKFVGLDSTLVHHLIQAVKTVGDLSLYCGYIETTYESGGREVPDSIGYSKLDGYNHIDLDIDRVSMNFELDNMVHLAGFERTFGTKDDTYWAGPILTLGPRLSGIEMEVDGGVEPDDPLAEEDPYEEYEKKHVSCCIFLFPTSAVKSLNLRTRVLLNSQSSWHDLKVVINSVPPPMNNPKYIEAICDIVVEACLMSKPFTDADIEDAGNFLKDSLRGVSTADLRGISTFHGLYYRKEGDSENKVEQKTSYSYHNYYPSRPRPPPPRTYTIVAQNFTRMLRLFPFEISEIFLPRFAGVLGSKFLVVDDNVIVAIRLLFELMSQEPEGRFTSILRKIFVQHPNENFRRMLDAEIKARSSPMILEIWGPLAFKTHEYIVEGIRKRFESNSELCFAYMDHQIAGFDAPGGPVLGRVQQLEWQLTSYFKILQGLGDPDLVRLIVQLLSAVKPKGHKQWVLEALKGVAHEIKELPSSSMLLQLQPGVVKTFLGNYQNAVSNLHPKLKSPPHTASLALPKIIVCARPASCSLCDPLNSFLTSTTKEHFTATSRNGEKLHYKQASESIGREIRRYIDIRSTGWGVKGADTVITISKRKKDFQGRHNEEVDEFRAALAVRRSLLAVIGVEVDDEGRIIGTAN
ncbi:hypothetical protein EYR41_011159 [Orbilia oligospora]|uniref:Uncharacterized protein n=1 Tax=Orbilia oligospora TaxID=2813651 RepID=A0A7C8KPL6_ORBOL|nr:hypothetical protein TWF751_007918 [Orbilia oligospora]TGJ63223.1 hypothetical protein EYR41_011159 [Orbilia oligospora]